LHFLDHGEAVRVLGLAADAGRDMLADPAYRAERPARTGAETRTTPFPWRRHDVA
jgi:hypothetical protein